MDQDVRTVDIKSCGGSDLPNMNLVTEVRSCTGVWVFKDILGGVLRWFLGVKCGGLMVVRVVVG